LNTGNQVVRSQHNLLSTVAYQIKGQTHYALEGSIFIAGAGVQWLRDGLHVISDARETEALARSVNDDHGVYLVPAFAGLGAPHWDPDCRGAIFGLTRGTTNAHLARATLEAVCYQTADLLDAMAQEGVSPETLRVDGGMVANNWLCQFLADMLGQTVERPTIMETTALGAAFLAGLQAGVYQFTPSMPKAIKKELLSGWHSAVNATKQHK
jgi:glycerol kinase